MSLAFDDLEETWQRLSAAMAPLSDQQERVFLAKLVLLLANEVGEPAKIERALRTAAQNLV